MTASAADVDPAALGRYLEARLGVGLVDTEVLHDGVNLALVVRTDDGRASLLRRPNAPREAPPFNELAQEYRVLELLGPTAVPAPEPVALCEDSGVIGAPFLLETLLEGEPLQVGADLPERFRTGPGRRRVAEGLVDTLAELHAVDAGPFGTVLDRRTPRDQVARLSDRFEATAGVTGHEPPGLVETLDWLRRSAPPDDVVALVHGDYRPVNVLLEGTDRPTVAGVLDWETAFLGDPRTDLGYLLFAWRDPGDPATRLDDLVASATDDDRRALQAIDEHGHGAFTHRPGSPSRRELVSRYEELTGLVFAHERFYRALAGAAIATVWLEFHARELEAGAASGWVPYVAYMASTAERIVRGEVPL